MCTLALMLPARRAALHDRSRGRKLLVRCGQAGLLAHRVVKSKWGFGMTMLAALPNSAPDSNVCMRCALRASFLWHTGLMQILQGPQLMSAWRQGT